MTDSFKLQRKKKNRFANLEDDQIILVKECEILRLVFVDKNAKGVQKM